MDGLFYDPNFLRMRFLEYMSMPQSVKKYFDDRNMPTNPALNRIFGVLGILKDAALRSVLRNSISMCIIN